MERHFRALDTLQRIHDETLAERGGAQLELDSVKLIDEMRDERDDEILANVAELRRLASR
jgi:hypothetical protein